jgi:hypothetical protein
VLNLASQLFKGDVGRLRKELSDRHVTVYVSDATLRDFIANAREDGSKDALATRADFISEWTMVDAEEAHLKYGDALSHLASKHALPRAWKHSEPAARVAEHPTPTYLYWASAS